MGGSSAKQIGQTQNLSAEQQQAFSQLFGGLDPSGAAQRLSSPEAAGEFFDQTIGAPQRKEFEQDLLPQIQEQFAGATSGSGFNRALTRSLSDFESNQSAQRVGVQQDAQSQQLDLLRSLLGISAATPIVQQATPGIGEQLGSGLGSLSQSFFKSKFGK